MLNEKSRVKGDFQARFCEGLGLKCPCLLGDIDILILLDTEKPTKEDIKCNQYPLYDIEFETGIIISPIVFSKKEWETKHKITHNPFL